jgi:CheY-like chemotaxis protein
VATGEEALAYLKGDGMYSDRQQHPLPSLVLLDLKLPGIGGFEVLRWIRQQPALAGLRVVVLTNSTDVRDANLAFRLGATSFIIKPEDFFRMVEFNEAVAGCWFWAETAPESARASSPDLIRQPGVC